MYQRERKRLLDADTRSHSVDQHPSYLLPQIHLRFEGEKYQRLYFSKYQISPKIPPTNDEALNAQLQLSPTNSQLHKKLEDSADSIQLRKKISLLPRPTFNRTLFQYDFLNNPQELESSKKKVVTSPNQRIKSQNNVATSASSSNCSSVNSPSHPSLLSPLHHQSICLPDAQSLINTPKQRRSIHSFDTTSPITGSPQLLHMQSPISKHVQQSQFEKNPYASRITRQLPRKQQQLRSSQFPSKVTPKMPAQYPWESKVNVDSLVNNSLQRGQKEEVSRSPKRSSNLKEKKGTIDLENEPTTVKNTSKSKKPRNSASKTMATIDDLCDFTLEDISLSSLKTHSQKRTRGAYSISEADDAANYEQLLQYYDQKYEQPQRDSLSGIAQFQFESLDMVDKKSQKNAKHHHSSSSKNHRNRFDFQPWVAIDRTCDRFFTQEG